MPGISVRLRQAAPISLDAEFTCEAGELVALVGPSGSGKTTILRMIAGLARCASGRIAVGAEVWLVGIREQNRAHAYAAMKHPGRFIPLAGIDPRRGDAMRMARECIEEWGMKGFKLMPSAGFHPDDPICWPLYEYCSDRKLPIMFHAGGIEVGWQCGAADVHLDSGREVSRREDDYGPCRL